MPTDSSLKNLELKSNDANVMIRFVGELNAASKAAVADDSKKQE